MKEVFINARKYEWIVGIDPDVSKSGFALISTTLKSVLWAGSYPFFELIDITSKYHQEAMVKKCGFLVVIEAGWLNRKSNFRNVYGARGENIAKKVGANHQVGKLIVEHCQHDKIDYIEAPPLIKCWGGNDRKITHEELAQFAIGTPMRTNQEVRDAILIAWSHASLPIRINIPKGI